jgi:hypothetical protein
MYKASAALALRKLSLMVLDEESSMYTAPLPLPASVVMVLRLMELDRESLSKETPLRAAEYTAHSVMVLDDEA